MALRGPLWMLGKCLREERAKGRHRKLAERLLDLGLLKTDSTRGHVFQATGAVQRFFMQHPRHRRLVNTASRTEPYKPTGQVLEDWLEFIGGADAKPYGTRLGFTYSYETLRGYLTSKYGGTRTGGGGGNNEFEIVMRLVAAFA